MLQFTKNIFHFPNQSCSYSFSTLSPLLIDTFLTLFRYFFAILFHHYFLSDSFFTHFFNTCSTLSLHFFKTFSTLYQHSLNTFATISLKMHYEHQSISWTTSISCLAIFFCLSKPCNNILKMYY